VTIVKGRRFGVYFSLMLAILALSGWAGWKLGGRAAVYRYRFHQRKLEELSPGRARFESTLSELDAVERVRIMAAVSENDEQLAKKILPLQVKALEGLRKKPDAQDLRSVIDLNLGFVWVYSAIAQERSNSKELAASYMKSAQPIFQSLGWQDYSDEALRAAAQRSLAPWSARLQTGEHAQ
jgi:hypothetical protein